METDRTVHAQQGHVEIVRYERAGKWYREWSGGRSCIPLTEAVENAIAMATSGGTVHYGRSGGVQFDKRVRDALPPAVEEES